MRLWPGGDYPETLWAKWTANVSHKQWHEWVSPDVDDIEARPELPIPPDDGAFARSGDGVVR